MKFVYLPYTPVCGSQFICVYQISTQSVPKTRNNPNRLCDFGQIDTSNPIRVPFFQSTYHKNVLKNIFNTINNYLQPFEPLIAKELIEIIKSPNLSVSTVQDNRKYGVTALTPPNIHLPLINPPRTSNTAFTIPHFKFWISNLFPVPRTKTEFENWIRWKI